jgi:hypothetical protein
VVALRLQTLAERIERVRIARRASEQRGARLRRAAESAAAVSLSGYRNAARLSPRDGAAAAAASAAAMASPESADGAEPAAEPRLQRENQALLEALRGDLDAALRTERCAAPRARLSRAASPSPADAPAVACRASAR